MVIMLVVLKSVRASLRQFVQVTPPARAWTILDQLTERPWSHGLDTARQMTFGCLPTVSGVWSWSSGLVSLFRNCTSSRRNSPYPQLVVFGPSEPLLVTPTHTNNDYIEYSNNFIHTQNVRMMAWEYELHPWFQTSLRIGRNLLCIINVNPNRNWQFEIFAHWSLYALFELANSDANNHSADKNGNTEYYGKYFA